MVDWKIVAEMMADEFGEMLSHDRRVIRIQRGVILALLILLMIAVAL